MLPVLGVWAISGTLTHANRVSTIVARKERFLIYSVLGSEKLEIGTAGEDEM
jgi:hypothetical protein